MEYGCQAVHLDPKPYSHKQAYSWKRYRICSMSTEKRAGADGADVRFRIHGIPLDSFASPCKISVAACWMACASALTCLSRWFVYIRC